MKCANCNRRAVWVVTNGFQGNGKYVCRSNVCWGRVTGGYPATGKPIKKS